MKYYFPITCSYLIGLVAITTNAGDLDTTVAACNDCHGDNGVSLWSDVPTIAGIPEFTHSEALFIYRDGARPCADSKFRQGDISRAAINMCDVAQDLSDEEIEAVAAYYAELPFEPAVQEFDAALAAMGEQVHEENCGICHTDGGANPEDEAGILAGQMRGYLERTFAEYRSDERDQPAKMKQKMDALSDDELEALVNYYASQQ